MGKTVPVRPSEYTAIHAYFPAAALRPAKQLVWHSAVCRPNALLGTRPHAGPLSFGPALLTRGRSSAQLANWMSSGSQTSEGSFYRQEFQRPAGAGFGCLPIESCAQRQPLRTRVVSFRLVRTCQRCGSTNRPAALPPCATNTTTPTSPMREQDTTEPQRRRRRKREAVASATSCTVQPQSVNWLAGQFSTPRPTAASCCDN